MARGMMDPIEVDIKDHLEQIKNYGLAADQE